MKNFINSVFALNILFFSVQACYGGCTHQGIGLTQSWPGGHLIQMGVPFSDTCQFYNNGTGANVYNDMIDIDSITGFPVGINSSVNSGTLSAQDCGFETIFSGTTSAHPGNYPLTVWGQLYHNGTPIGHGNLQTEFDSGANAGWWAATDITFNLVIACYAVATPSLSGPDTSAAQQTSNYSTPLQAGYTYHWNILNGNVSSGQGTDSISVLWDSAGTGTVNLFVADSFGCTSNSASLNIVVEQASGIAGIVSSGLTLYPNPAKDRLMVTLYKSAILSITNILGETVLEQKLYTSGYLDISALKPDVYIIYNKKEGTAAKFIKE